MSTSVSLDDVFAALAHPARREIVAVLSRGPATVNALAEPFEMSLPAVSNHIRVLEDAGLVIRAKKAQFRPCSLNPEALRDVSTWAEQYRSIWEGRFEQMDVFLQQLKRQDHEPKS